VNSKLLWILRWASGLCAFVFVLAVALTAGVLHLLRPGPGEWSAPLHIGPWRGELSGPALLRIATHPVVLTRLEGRVWRTPLGPLTVQAGLATDRWRAVCAPCSLQIDSLGREPLRMRRVEFSWQRDVRMDLTGEFVLSSGLARDPAPGAAQGGDDALALGPALHGRWHLRNGVQQVELSLSLKDAPLAQAFGLFSDRLPELERARINGQLNLELSWQWPSRAVTVKPRLDGFVVAGLGTELLLDALPSCPAPPGTANFGAWLPRAVLAAEDQRFFEHTGFDLVELGAAFSSEPRPGATRRGASTLSQQLAKLIYTGDETSHLRKLRELLYAVELDRTLGKARVLKLYLALAPWGAGECGAAAAAARFLGQGLHELDPLDAAWLASLLRNPDAELAQMARTGQANALRVRWIVEHLRPLNRAKRRVLLDAMDDWAPPPRAFEAAAAVQSVRLAASSQIRP
jgi:Transglycosylase